MRKMKILVPLVMLALFVWVGLGCSNPDNLNLPEVPNTGGDGPPGDLIDPTTPTPYAEGLPDSPNILDFAFEKDGDLAISEAATGIHLFDTFGEYKRNISPGQAGFEGLIDVVPGAWDSGRGVIATSSTLIGCGWVSFYDDLYVTGGTLGPGAPGWWISGEAHPPSPDCSMIATSGIFECDDNAPRGIDIHPITGWLFVRLDNLKITLDGGDCDLDEDEIPPKRDLDPGILAMHPLAPAAPMGFDPDFYEGSYDWIVYHNKVDYDLVLFYGYPMASASVQYVVWCEDG